MDPRSTLIVHAAYFPQSLVQDDAASDPGRLAAIGLGAELYSLLTRSPENDLGWGAGVAVRVGSRHDKVDLQEAQRSVVATVLGARLHALAPIRTQVLSRLCAWRDGGALVLPIVEPESPWRAALHDALPGVEVVDHERVADAVLRGVVRALLKSQQRVQLLIAPTSVAPDRTGLVAERIRSYVAQSPEAREYFEPRMLRPGDGRRGGAEAPSVFGVYVPVRGDRATANSPWPNGLLAAKASGIPVLSVEALVEGEPRTSPYGGNVRAVVWDAADEEASARRVVVAATVEWIRHHYFLAEGKRIAELAGVSGARPVSRPPELLDLAQLRAAAGAGNTGPLIILHPDPPLSSAERALLVRQDKLLRAITPTTLLGARLSLGQAAPLAGWSVALSLSDSPDAGGSDGLTAEHARDATVFLARTLVANGATLAYGGDFRKNGYTDVLARLVSEWSESAGEPAECLQSFLAAHVVPDGKGGLAYTENSLGLGGLLASEALLPAPQPGQDVPRHRMALYNSDMRRVMEHHVDARVVLGGKTRPVGCCADGYSGRFPGLVEEAWRSLEKGTPLYVLGGFGGAAAIVASLLCGKPTPNLLDETSWASSSDWTSLLRDLANDPDAARLSLPATQEALADAVRTWGRVHLERDDTSRAWNGLSRADNLRLFETRDPVAAASLVFQGLLVRRASKNKGKLQIEAVLGDVREAQDHDVLVVAGPSDLPPLGLLRALDEATAGALRASRSARGPVANPARSVGTEFVFCADLGSDQTSTRMEARIRAAADQAAQMCLRYRFSRIGLATFPGEAEPGSAAVEFAAHVDGLAPLAERRISWYERHPQRFDALRTYLAGRPDVALSTRRIASAPSSPIRDRTYLPVRESSKGSVLVDLYLPKTNALVPSREVPFDGLAQSALASGAGNAAPSMDELEQRGRDVAALLFDDAAPQVGEELRESELVVVHDALASSIPFEAIRWRSPGGDEIVPALSLGVTRRLWRPETEARRALLRPSVQSMKVCVVIDPTSNLPAAHAEGMAVGQLLQGMRDLGVQLEIICQKDATVGRIGEELAKGTIDVLHYCGHGFYNGPGPDGSGLQLADGPFTVGQLREVGPDRLPRLAIFNACEGGRLGPGSARPDGHDAEAFAEFFLAGGVEAYISTFWEVTDSGAEVFSQALYRALIGGAELGAAMTEGRLCLHKVRSPDWANYMLYGNARFRLVRAL